jgi:O-antigen ligase
LNKNLTLKDKIQFYLLVLLSCFIILPTGIQSISVILLVFFSLIFQYKYIQSEILKKGFKPYLFTVLWLVLLYLTLFYSFELKAGIVYIKKSISILILPFVILYTMPKLTKKHFEFIFRVFVFSCVLLILYTFFTIMDNLFSYYSNAILNKSFFYKLKYVLSLPHSEIMWYGLKEAEETQLMIHKTYLALNLVFSIFIVLHIFIKRHNGFLKNIKWFFLIIFLSLPVFLFLSFLNIIILFFGIFLFCLYFISNRKNKIIFTVGIILLGFLSLYFLNNYARTNSENNIIQKSILSKFNYVLSTVSNDQNVQKNKIDSRSLIHECALELIKLKPVFGYGLGVQHIYLTNCFAEKGDFVMFEANYNSHNYYLFLLLSGGLMVLIPFCVMLVYFFRDAFNSGNFLFIAFLVLISSNFLIENILSRINGIIFISFFIPMLFCYNNYKSLDQCK